MESLFRSSEFSTRSTMRLASSRLRTRLIAAHTALMHARSWNMPMQKARWCCWMFTSLRESYNSMLLTGTSIFSSAVRSNGSAVVHRAAICTCVLTCNEICDHDLPAGSHTILRLTSPPRPCVMRARCDVSHKAHPAFPHCIQQCRDWKSSRQSAFRTSPPSRNAALS